jgi:uroporphyrinogen-III synthase
MRILVTRPETVAAGLAAALAARGHEAVVAPLLEIEPVPGDALDLAGCQAILLTSANAVTGLATRDAPRELPVFAVGDATAAAAAEAGFGEVRSAGGDARDLARLVLQTLRPTDGALLHACGRDRAVDFAQLLGPHGFEVRRLVVYAARPAARLPAAAADGLARGTIDAVLLFSPRTAATFARLAGEVGLEGACAKVAVVCLSDAVADAVKGLHWRSVVVARTPDTDAALEAVDGVARSAERATAGGTTKREAMAGHESTPGDDTGSEAPEASSADEKSVGAQHVIERFGGIRPMAAKLGVPVTTVQGWKERHAIPEARHDEILDAAARHGIELSEEDFGTPASSAEETPAEPASVPEERPETSEEGPRAAPPSGHAAPPSHGLPGALVWVALGVAVVALAVGLYALVLAPRPDGKALERRVAALENAPAPAAGVDPAAFESLRSTVSGLAESLKKIQSQTAALGQKLEAAMAQSGAGSDLTTALKKLNDRVAALEAAPQPAAADTALKSQVDDLTKQVSDLATASAASNGDAVDRLTKQIDALNRKVEAISAGAADKSAVESLKGELDRIAGDAADLGSKIDTVEQSVKSLSSSVQAESAAASRPAALVFAVGRLADAAARSAPFGDEVRAVEALANGDPKATAALETLRPLALDGVPTLAVLRADFDAMARAVAKAAQQPEGGDLVDRIVGRVTTLVTVRPVGPNAKGSSPGAILARAEADLESGDLTAAVSELKALSGAAREAAAPWLTRAQARLDTNQAVERLQAWAIASLASPTPAAAPAPAESAPAESAPGAANEAGQGSGG